MDYHSSGPKLQPSLSLPNDRGDNGQSLPNGSRPIDDNIANAAGGGPAAQVLSTEEAARILASRLPVRGEEPSRVPKLIIPQSEADDIDTRAAQSRSPSWQSTLSTKAEKGSPTRHVLGIAATQTVPSNSSFSEAKPMIASCRRSPAHLLSAVQPGRYLGRLYAVLHNSSSSREVHQSAWANRSASSADAL